MAHRRFVLIVALIGALAVPMADAAPTTSYRGSVTSDPNSKLTFKVVKNDRGKKRVEWPKTKNLDATCESGPEEIDTSFGNPKKPVKVSKTGEFDFDNSQGNYIAYVRGRLRGVFASGVLRFQGPTTFDDEVVQNCDTGEVKWTAEKA